MSTIITPSEDQINIVITDDAVNVNVTSEPVVVNVTEEIIQVSPISGAYPLPSTVYSVFGRTGSVVAQEGDYDLGKLSDVVLLDLANNDVLSYNGTNWVNEPMDLSGYVTLATDQTITGSKIFEKGLLLKNISSPLSQVGFTGISGCSLNNGIDIIFNGTNNIQGLFFETSTSHDYTFPDFSGTLALLEADQSFSGQKTFTDITFFNQSASFLYGAAFKKGNTSSVMGLFQTDVFITAATGNKNIVIQDISTSFAKLQFQNTGNLTYTFPAASGTIALTSDIPSLTGYVPYTGATTHLNLGIWGLGASTITVGQNSTQGYIRFRTGGATQLSAETCQAPYGTNGMIFSFDQTSSNYKQFVLNSSLLTNNTIRTYSMPDASGTIALTSNLASYVPYTGATSTLNLGSQMLMTSGYIRGGNSLQVLYNPSSSTYDSGYNTIQGNATSFAVINPTTGFRLIFPSTASYFYTLPDATGTIALTSDIPSTSTFVPYTGATGDVNLGVYNFLANTITTKNDVIVSNDGGNAHALILENGTGAFSTGTNAISLGSDINNINSLIITSDIATEQRYASFSLNLLPNNSQRIYYLPNLSGTLALTSNLVSYVPYTGANTNVNLGVYNLTANALIKNGGVDTQFLKADGSVDNNVYLTANDLPSTLSLYATTTASAVSGYTKLVTTIDDPDYNTTAVDVSTGTITTANQFIAALVSPANLINGNPGIFNVSTYGNIKKVSGTGTAEFYFKIYKRTSAGVETLVGTSSNTIPVVNSGYSEFFATAIWNDGVFDVTDTIVLKYYGSRITGGSDPLYNFQFGGVTPVRTLVPIPIAVIPNIYMADLADVENVAPLNNEVLHYNSTSTLWEHSTIAGLLGYTPANDASVVHISGSETITGNKTFSGLLASETGLVLKQQTGISMAINGYTNFNAFSTELQYSIGTGATTYKYFSLQASGLTNNTLRTYTLPNASGTIALTSDIPSLTGYVPYTGATANVTLGAYSLTAASLIKSGGTSAQILAADGSVITAGTNITISGGTISASGGGGGSISLAAIGSTPNANGATLTGSVLNLEPASASFGGVVTTGTQTFAGAKTFGSALTVLNQSSYFGTVKGYVYIFDDQINAYYSTNAEATLVMNYYGYNAGSTQFRNLDIYNGKATKVFNIVGSTGNIGIGNPTGIGSKLQVNGNAAIGYSASTAAPTNGLVVSGVSGFGTSSPNASYNFTVVRPVGGSGNIWMEGNSSSTGLPRITWNNALNSAQVLQQMNAATGGMSFTGTVTAATAVAQAMIFNQTLVAAANNDVLVGMDINPTFTNGAFTGLQNIALRIQNGDLVLVNNRTIRSASSADSVYTYGGSLFSNGAYFGVSGNSITNNRQKGAVEFFTDISNASIDSGSVSFGTHSAGSSFTWRMLMFKSGNLLLTNTAVAASLPTDNSYRLDVQGTLRTTLGAVIGYSATTAAPTNGLAVSGNTGIGTNTPTDSILGLSGKILDVTGVAGSAYKIHLTTAGYGELSIAKSTNGNYFDSAGATVVANNDIIFRTGATVSSYAVTEVLRITGSGNIGIGNPTAIGSKLQINGNAAIGYSASTAAPTNGMSVAGTVNVGTNTSVTTAALQISSTTQGFLPPVMTTTQKNAISTPATGLVVFDSTLGKLCVFSTTWQTITSV